MSIGSPTAFLLWSILSCIFFVFLILHLWSYDRFECLKWSAGRQPGAFKRVMTYSYLGTVPLLCTFSLAITALKFREGYIQIHGQILPKPVALYQPQNRQWLLPLYFLLSIGWSLELVTHLEELTFWLYLLHQGPGKQPWFQSWEYRTWYMGSVLAVLGMPLFTLLTRRELETCIAWIFLGGTLAGTTITLCFIYVLARFPSFIEQVKAGGAEPDVVVRLATFYQLNTIRVMFRFIFTIPLMILAVDGLFGNHHIVLHPFGSDFLLMMGGIGCFISSAITLLIFFPRSIAHEEGYRAKILSPANSANAQQQQRHPKMGSMPPPPAYPPSPSHSHSHSHPHLPPHDPYHQHHEHYRPFSYHPYPHHRHHHQHNQHNQHGDEQQQQQYTVPTSPKTEASHYDYSRDELDSQMRMSTSPPYPHHQHHHHQELQDADGLEEEPVPSPRGGDELWPPVAPLPCCRCRPPPPPHSYYQQRGMSGESLERRCCSADSVCRSDVEMEMEMEMEIEMESTMESEGSGGGSGSASENGSGSGTESGSGSGSDASDGESRRSDGGGRSRRRRRSRRDAATATATASGGAHSAIAIAIARGGSFVGEGEGEDEGGRDWVPRMAPWHSASAPASRCGHGRLGSDPGSNGGGARGVVLGSQREHARRHSHSHSQLQTTRTTSQEGRPPSQILPEERPRLAVAQAAKESRLQLPTPPTLPPLVLTTPTATVPDTPTATALPRSYSASALTRTRLAYGSAVSLAGEGGTFLSTPPPPSSKTKRMSVPTTLSHSSTLIAKATADHNINSPEMAGAAIISPKNRRRFSDGPFLFGRHSATAAAAAADLAISKEETRRGLGYGHPSHRLVYPPQLLRMASGGTMTGATAGSVRAQIKAVFGGSGGEKRGSKQLHPYVMNFTSPIDLWDPTVTAVVSAPSSPIHHRLAPLPLHCPHRQQQHPHERMVASAETVLPIKRNDQQHHHQLPQQQQHYFHKHLDLHHRRL